MEQHSEENEETMEDVAERYLDELVQRCMVLVGKRDSSLRIATCRMHDLMRNLCLSKAKEENFLHVVDCQNEDENVNSFRSLSSGKIRRLAINQYGGPLKHRKDHHLRSLAINLYEDPLKHTENHLPISLLSSFEYQKNLQPLEKSFFKNFKRLRVLDLERTFVPWRPKDIGNLFHLRFLSLRNAYVSELPSSLGNLRFLQTLDLQIEGMVYIPNVLWKLEDLRHLYLPERCDSKTKLRLGNLKYLQTLVNFSLRNFGVGDLLNNMSNLRDLNVQHLNLIKDFGETFESRGITLRHLRSLTIGNYPWESSIGNEIDVGSLVLGCINLYELRLCVRIESLPDCLPTSITHIFLYVTGLEDDPMSTLEKLPHLKTLTLHLHAFIGRQMVCSGGGFPLLNSLRLYRLENLEEWRVDKGGLLNLCHLEISYCRKLKMFPDGLSFVKALLELEIIGMPKKFKDQLGEGGDDHYKVQHAPVKFQFCDK